MMKHYPSTTTCVTSYPVIGHTNRTADALMKIAQQQPTVSPLGGQSNNTDQDTQEATIARCTADAIRQFHTQPNPFTWENQVALATHPAAGHAHPALHDAVESYYLMLADCFEHMPLTLPLPTNTLRRTDYRRQCFYAWLGQAVLKGLNVDLGNPFTDT